MHRRVLPWLASVLLVCGCATLRGRPQVPRVTPAAPLSAEELLSAVESRSTAIRSFRALAEMRYVGPRGQLGVREVVVVERPNHLRLEMMSAFGVALQIATDGERLCAYHRGDQAYYRGRATTQNLARFIRVDLAVEDVVDLLIGIPPRRSRIGQPTLAFEPPLALWRVTTALAEHRSLTLWFDPDSMLPTRALELDGRGGTRYGARYADYTTLSGIAMPTTVRFELPEQAAQVDLRYSDVSLNPDLAAGLFCFDPPPGAKVVDLDQLPPDETPG